MAPSEASPKIAAAKPPLESGKVRPARPSRWVALAVLALMIAGAAAAPVLSPHPPLKQSLAQRLQAPMWIVGGSPDHLMGTDQLGRDILSRILHGGRISLMVGLLAVLLSGSVGTFLGLIAGHMGGAVDRLLMRLAEIQLAFPFILLVVAIVSVLGASATNVVLALGISGWVTYAKLVRAQVLTLRELAYVEAARALGAAGRRIAFRHLLPNAVSPVIVLASFSVAQMIILESALSFLGLGVQPPTPTWGGMLADSRTYLATAWWLATFPGLVLMLTVLAINILGDWLRDILDPTMAI
ncbi:MAG: ABC transporter permease [Candidatus Rokubacteria bacterium]|nr:ABC transporter permease [Candidatus Rokubacteria bacterium]